MFCAVTLSTLRPESSLSYYKPLAVSLAVLAVVLLAVNIGLGVYCKLFNTNYFKWKTDDAGCDQWS